MYIFYIILSTDRILYQYVGSVVDVSLGQGRGLLVSENSTGGEYESAVCPVLEKALIVVVLGCRDCNIDCPVATM